ncbi:DUF3566 domain-containing protein [Pseudonocardia endophytica]|uniref:Transmembrane protein DUF3566 n=1 Tax=Pseudonocardia endophytica TaxID=401976 RepID=A0A4R1HZ04_PSEEN|nr:transmembrane protein DUF3566 [Pseudonocardia endophytica]
MSSNDSTRPEDDGRTVATDADRAEQSSPPGPDAAAEDATGAGGESAAARPSPVPRPASPDARWEAQAEGETSDAGAANGSSSAPSASTPASSTPSPATAEPAAAAASSTPQAEGPPPWRRVPGDQPAPEEPERPTVADSLLSEAPTTFLTGPRGASAEAEPAAGGTAVATEEQPGGDTNGRAPSSGVRPSARNRPPRQALLQLKRLDPWSVLKMALALAVVLFLVWMVAAGVLYGILGGMGVWDRLNGTYADLVTGQAQDSGSLISAGRVFLLAAVVGAINSLLFAVALTIGAFVYNVAADLVGGIEVTLSERD